MFVSRVFILVYVIAITYVMADDVYEADEQLSLMERYIVWGEYEVSNPHSSCDNHQYVLADIDRRNNRTTTENARRVVKACGYPCSAWGEPHYSTFDGKFYSFMGTCAYIQAKTFRSPHDEFTVIVENKEARPPWSSVFRVIVKVYGYTIEMRRSYNGGLLVNGIDIPQSTTRTYYWQPEKFVTVYWLTNLMEVTTDFGLYVSYNGEYDFDMIVPEKYFNHTRGLCGNNDRDPSNDFIKRNEQLTWLEVDFGSSWKDEEYSAPGCYALEVDPTCSDVQLNDAMAKCGLFRSGGFVECNSVIDPENIRRTCVFDLCAIDSNTEFKCSHYKKYAEDCRRVLGHSIDWRQFVPGCEIQCPANSHFNFEYDPSCENTCAMPLASAICLKGDFRKIEGCLCNSGYVREYDKCIQETNCGCIDDEGMYHRIGESWIDCSGVSCKCDAKNTISCSCNGLSACSPPRFSTALCLCGGATCPRVCTLDSNGVVKHQSTTHTALANSMKHVIVETLTQGDYPCKMNIQVRMDNFAVNFIGVNFGAWPNKPSEYAFNAAFNLWDSTGVTIRGYKLVFTTYKNTAPPAWNDGLASVLITRVSANVWKLTASCYGHKMAEVNVNAPGQPLGVIDVKYPDMFGGRCYA